LFCCVFYDFLVYKVCEVAHRRFRIFEARWDP
jgi:hypothetical protein